MNTEEALKTVRIVRAAFPSQKFDEFTIDVWAAALRDAEFTETRDAIHRLVQKQTFASVAEILAEARLARREGMRQVLDQQTFQAIETARSEHERNHQRAHEAYLDAKQAFDDALEAKAKAVREAAGVDDSEHAEASS